MSERKPTSRRNVEWVSEGGTVAAKGDEQGVLMNTPVYEIKSGKWTGYTEDFETWTRRHPPGETI
jgi:hypothetical protein